MERQDAWAVEISASDSGAEHRASLHRDDGATSLQLLFSPDTFLMLNIRRCELLLADWEAQNAWLPGGFLSIMKASTCE